MKNFLSLTHFILIAITAFLGCRGPETDSTSNASTNFSLLFGDNYKAVIDTRQSAVAWKGSMLVGTNSHTGFVSLSKGNLTIENGQLVGGSAEIDMNTIADETRRSNNDLVTHLKSDDFFDVAKFPISKIAITKVEPTKGIHQLITGNLTIKGITNTVTFPAQTEVQNGNVKISGRLAIDRTKWNVKYKSGKFYDLLADQTMSDSIEFHINIVAKK